MAEKKRINAKDTYNKLELEAVKKVNDYKLICESNIVATLWKNKDLYYDYDKIIILIALKNVLIIYKYLENK